jgi:DNA-binding response OmpR family regulator
MLALMEDLETDAVEAPLPLMLVVDDEQGNRMLLKRLFEREFQVICAENGADALDLLVQAPFDLVLLDVMMPTMTGLELLQRMRSRPALAEIPVILVTALAENRFIIEGLQMGANDYVTKPFETDVLRARVQTQLTMKRLLDERKEHILQLEAAQSFKDRSFQMASHDLKGPLGNLKMAHSLIRASLPDEPRVKEVMEMAELTVRNMRSVIDQFLDLAAMQNGNIEIRLREVKVDEAIRDLVSQYALTASE